MFLEQLKEGLRPWKPLKDYARVPFTPLQRKVSTTMPMESIPGRIPQLYGGTVIKGALSAAVEIPEGEYNPVGLTYAQISAADSDTKDRRMAVQGGASRGKTRVRTSLCFASPRFRKGVFVL